MSDHVKLPIPMSMVETLTHQACFAADTVAIDNRHTGMTGAQQTHAIVRRTIEFLIGNGLIDVVDQGSLNPWIKPDPPYDPERIEPAKED